MSSTGIGMMEFILHVGRHKTGTTSIQHFLARNAKDLIVQGFLYPSHYQQDAAHHQLTKLLKTNDSGKIANGLSLLIQEAEKASCRKIIISSETFQGFHRPQYLLQFFPSDSTHVVAYIRDPVEYFVSTYQQMVQASKLAISLNQYENQYKMSLANFVTTWRNAYDSFTLRLFSRDRLYNSDVVDDFCSVVDIDTTGLSKVEVKNLTIGGNLLLYKLALNRVSRECRFPASLIGQLEQIAFEEPRFTGKIPLNSSFRARLQQRFVDDIRLLEREFSYSVKTSADTEALQPILLDLNQLHDDFANIHMRLMELGLVELPLEKVLTSLSELVSEIF
jgi:hypothetical protein